MTKCRQKQAIKGRKSTTPAWESIITFLGLKWQLKGVMGTCPVAHRFSNPTNNRKFMGKHTRWDDRKG